MEKFFQNYISHRCINPHLRVKKRHVAKKILKLLEMFPVVALIGARQCGKSTLAVNLLPDWQYYDLENPNDYQLVASDPVAFFSLHDACVVIDEAQEFPDLFKVLRGVIDDEGRIATVEMAPFKQTEFYDKPLPDLYELIADNPSISDLRQIQAGISMKQSLHIWFRGGFPEPLIEGTSQPDFYRLWMENYIKDYIARDIRGLFPKLNMHNFRRFLMMLAQFSGHQLNMSKMAGALEVSVSTVKDYLDIIHQTFIWRNLDPYVKNPLKKVQKAKKGFFRDQGLLHYLLRIQHIDDLLLHPVAGFSFESFVIEEIIRGLQATMAAGFDFSYYRTVDKSEVDLVVEGFSGVLPIEVKLNSMVKRKELRGLENFISDMKAELGLVVNRGRSVQMLSEKILQIPVHYI
ncbi:MAG: ATPase [Desulfobacteraceae bacterium 4484_190.1]|nr:MAG: ATPase [Desulfobacteraceae bacterium 4484_190.1]